MIRLRGQLILLFCAYFAAPICHAQAEPVTDGLVVRDVVVLFADQLRTKLNERGAYRSSLPAFVDSRREPADLDNRSRPMPLGMMTFDGPDDLRFDVLIELDAGRFLAVWPATEKRQKRVLWQDVVLTNAGTDVRALPSGHWLSPLRDMNRKYIAHNHRTDRFLLYDVELNHTLPITIESVADGYKVTNGGNTTLSDVLLVRRQGESWSASQIQTIAGATATADKPAAPATQPATAAPASQPAPAAPAPAPTAKQPAGPSAEFKMLVDPAAGLDGTFAEFSSRLHALGLEGEAEHALGIVRHCVTEARGLVVIYRLSDQVLEKILPMEITPLPGRRVRVGLVVHVNADPAVDNQMDELVAQLGDPVWRKREAAMQRLLEMGPAIRPHLETAIKNKDVEIVWRAEQLLEQMKTAPTP